MTTAADILSLLQADPTLAVEVARGIRDLQIAGPWDYPVNAASRWVVGGDGAEHAAETCRADFVGHGVRWAWRIDGDDEWILASDNDPMTARAEADAALDAKGWRRA